jgi:hypothetical protein
MRSLLIASLLAACGGAPQRTLQPPRGYAAHMAAADDHDAAADAQDHAAAEARAGQATAQPRCGAPVVSVIADQTTSGGERIGSWVPCWTVEREAADRHHAEAVKLRQEAHVDRAIARNLVAVEREFCAVLTPDELTHTPFWHREDIDAVTPYVEDDRVRGVRVRFKPVVGLTPQWLRAAILCHQARAATLGHPPTYLDYDPTLVVGVHVVVNPRGDATEVLVRAEDDGAAAIVGARANALLARPVMASPAPPAPTTH